MLLEDDALSHSEVSDSIDLTVDENHPALLDAIDSQDKRVVNFIGDRMRSIRISLGYTQGAFSELLNVTFQQVQKYEKGLNRISACSLWNLANRLGIDVSYFFPDQNSAGSNTSSFVAEKSITFNYNFPKENDCSTREVSSLVRDFCAITNPSTRKHILAIVTSLSQSESMQNVMVQSSKESSTSSVNGSNENDITE